MKLFKGAIPLIFAGIGLFAGQAWAAPITVNNFSFETPALSSGGFTTVCPASWTCTAAGGSQTFGGGEYFPVTTQFPSGSNGLTGGKIVPDGNNAAYDTGFLPSTIRQDTAATIANNTIYTLDVWAGRRNDQASVWPKTPTIELLANGVVIASLAVPEPVSGHWLDNSLTYTAGPSDIHAGQTLGILLLLNQQSNGDSTSLQVAWDDVTLNAVSTAVPEPTTLLLLGSGLFAFGLISRYRPRRKITRSEFHFACD